LTPELLTVVLGDRGGQVATGAVATDADLRGINAEFGRVFDGPGDGGDGVVVGGGELVLGCHAVVE